MLAQRHRQWANISPALGQRLVFAGVACDCTMETAGQTDRQKGQTHLADKGKPACPHFCVQRGRHNNILGGRGRFWDGGI